MKPFIPRWLALIGILLLLPCATLAQPDFEDRTVAQLAGGDEEARLNALVELAALFKTGRRRAQPATIAVLIHTLQNDATPTMRTHAARVLEYAAPPSATDGLLTALQNEREIATRKAIIYALARYPAPPVVAALIPLLRHKQVEIRATTAYALAELADTAAASALHECLVKQRKEHDAFTRAEAARGLGRIGYRVALPDLHRALRKDNALVRRAAAEALGWLATPNELDVMRALQEAALAEDPYLRESAALALKRISERALSYAPFLKNKNPFF